MGAILNRKEQLQIMELFKFPPTIHILNNKATDPECGNIDYSSFFFLINLYWSIIASQYHVNFCCITK